MNRLLAALISVLSVASVMAGEVYDDVLSELSRHESRLPGGEGFLSSVSAIEAKLKKAGLSPRRMSFNTLVPRTKTCEFKVDGARVSPAYPLGPNGFAPNTTGAVELSGRLVWLGDASLEEMDGKNVEGSIALMRFRSPNMQLVFSQGAKAVVFVGDGTETQWQAAKHFTEMPMAVPRLFISSETAEKAGLMEKAASSAKAGISIRTGWEEVQSLNLWAEIKGEPGKTFHLDREEAIIFGASIDTFGVVPDLSPELRSAANCALLAELACSLAESGLKPSRSIYFVFFGGRYSAQDGARNFYFAIDKTEEGGWNNDHLDMRDEAYRDEFELLSGQLQMLRQEDFFQQPPPELRPYFNKTLDRLSKRLDAMVNNLNFEIQLASFENSKRPSDELKERERKLKQEKTAWNDMRRQIMRREIKSKESFRTLVEDISSELLQHKADTLRMIENNKSFMELGESVKGKAIVGHFDLDFASAGSPWIFNMMGDARATRGESPDHRSDISLGNYTKSLSTLAEICRGLEKPEWPAKPFAEAAAGFYTPLSLCVPAERSMPSNVAAGMGIYGYQMMSIGDPLDRDELPFKAPAPDLAGLLPMLSECARAFSSEDSLSIRGPVMKVRKYQPITYFRKNGEYAGVRYMNFSRGSSSELEGPAANSIAAVVGGSQTQFRRTPISGHSRIPIGRVNNEGYVFIPNVAHFHYPQNNICAYGFDKDGLLDRFPVQTRKDRLFYAYGGAFYSPFDPLNYGIPMASKALNAKNNSAFRNSVSYYDSGMACLYYDKPYDFKWLSDGLTLIGAQPSMPLGYGIPFDKSSMLSLNVLRNVASDYCVLNQSRLDVLRRKNIVNDSIELLHAEASERLASANEARKRLDNRAAAANETFSCALGYRACKPLRDIANDMVQAVVVLLLLSIPFAFFMERLLFGFTSIYRQVAGFASIFMATFALLYVIHPAFSLASAPIVIFLAFVIVLMSAIVIYIVMTKFKLELKSIQGLASTVHGAASESGTAMASVLIGISGMRNRPLKTFLTAATVILLTFTILVFASFSSSIGVVETYLGKGQGPDRIEIHRFTFLSIPPHFVSAVKTIYEKNWDVFSRSACFNDPTSIDPLPDRVAFSPASGKALKIDAILGFDPGELSRNPELAQLAPALAEAQAPECPQPIMLSPTSAAALALKEGDSLLICGQPFVFKGCFNPLSVEENSYLDGSKLTPPDFAATQQETDKTTAAMTSKESEGGQQIDISAFTYFSPQQSAITTLKGLANLAPVENFIVMYPRKDAGMKAAAKELAQVFQGPVYAKGPDGSRQYFFTKEMKASGFSEVIVPLLLGGLIIFSSLLGSIVERSKEIFTYSALGLAPPDVGALFFAESSVYAVLGGMGGYLLSQLVSFLLTIMASYGLFHPPEMNFSSLSSVLTILVVMATVILSTIYPALKAGKSANPGVARKWRMPKPEAGRLKFTFPFTVSASDMDGILCFVKEHFENHGDASLGNFAAAETSIFKDAEADSSLGIKATISLAPFDLGVFQSFRMYSKPSEIAGIDEIVLEIERLNGTEGAWLRGNRVFIDELRNQFLLWRSLPVETVAHYKSQGGRIAASTT